MSNIHQESNGQHNRSGDLPLCGMVRPIALVNELYPAGHWQEVHDIVAIAVAEAGFNLRLVSDGGGASIIVSQIIENLSSDPIVIVDVSSRNPNVMFELGMRVTFERPVIIIKDDVTDFSFDITPIRHLTYQRDLRHSKMKLFQEDLKNNILETVEAANTDNYKHYLRQFAPVKITKLETRQVSIDEFAQEIQEMRRDISQIVKNSLGRSGIDSNRSFIPNPIQNVESVQGPAVKLTETYFEIDTKIMQNILVKINETPNVHAVMVKVDGERSIIKIKFPDDRQSVMRQYLITLVANIDQSLKLTFCDNN